MTISEWQWIANFGFAAIVAIHVLTRLEPAIKDLNRTVRLLSIIVAKCSGLDYQRIEKDYDSGVDIR